MKGWWFGPKVNKAVFGLSRIPNTKWTRFGVEVVNLYLKTKGSRWRMAIRYRCPKTGKYGYGGSVRQANAARFALYWYDYERRLLFAPHTETLNVLHEVREGKATHRDW